MRIGFLSAVTALVLVAGSARSALAQGYGSDAQNVLMPASGGMAGVSVARPQDVPSAVFGNPSTLAQFHGTQFTMGGSWVEGYPTVTFEPLVGEPYSVTSRTQGFAGPAVAVVQDLDAIGVPGSLGIGLAGLSGLGAEYRGRAPEGSFLNNVSSEYLVLGINMGAGVELTDQLSAGAAVTLGTGYEQLGFVGPLTSTAMVHDYALRATLGIDYDFDECNTVGAYYQSKMSFQYPNAVRFNDEFRNLQIDQPETVGFGYANRSLMGGNLLLAADVYYKLWEDADLWRDVFVNQWAFAVGAQLTRGRIHYRLGYSYNDSPINHDVGDNLDGFPVLADNVRLFQAASVAFVNQHRLTGGIGVSGFLVPALDLDLFAGGLFEGDEQFGDRASASAAAYYLGTGLTWRFGACSPHAR